MNTNTINDKTRRTQVAAKNVAFCAVILLVFGIGLSSSALAAKNVTNAGKISIEVDPRVELVGIVFRLAGAIPPPTRSLNMA